MRIITGCSRSGTSFVSQAIHHLGGSFGTPGDLIEGDRWNRKGYFENRRVNTLNHRLLFGPWSNPKLWIDFMWPKNPWIHLRKLVTVAQGPLISHPGLVRRRGRKLRNEMVELGKSLEGTVVKDPRFSYLMKPWVDTGTVHSVLYVVRNPREASMSMSRQTKLPLALTYLGWIDAVEKFWSVPLEVPVHIVDYNAFFEPDGREGELRTLFKFLGREFDAAAGEEMFEKVLDRGMRTQKVGEKKLPERVRKIYESVLDRKPGN